SRELYVAHPKPVPRRSTLYPLLPVSVRLCSYPSRSKRTCRKDCRGRGGSVVTRACPSHLNAAPSGNSRSFAASRSIVFQACLAHRRPMLRGGLLGTLHGRRGIRIQRIPARIERIGRTGERDRDTGPNYFGGAGRAVVRQG